MLPARAAIRRTLIHRPPLSNASPWHPHRQFTSIRLNNSTIVPSRRPLISLQPYSFQLSALRFQSSNSGLPKTPTTQKQEDQPPIDKSQPEFDGPQDLNANTVPPETDPQSQAHHALPDLPDLRQGLPSTWAQEYLKKPFDDPTGKRTDIDITDHESESDGSRYGPGGRENPPKAAYKTSIDRRRESMARLFFWIGVTGVVGLVAYWGRNWGTKYEENMHPAAPNGWHPIRFWNRIVARYRDFTGYYTEPTFPKLLPIVTDLNIPPYTLVLSLEDLLVHSEWSREHGWRTAKRPGADFFLLYLSQYYELCLFTSVPSAMGDPIYKKLDPYHVIMWPLYREATRYEGGDYVKDLSYLNRPLNKTILVDTKKSHAKAQPENAIILKPWNGDPNDRELLALVPFLEYLAIMGTEDIRSVLASFDGTHIPTEFAEREARMRVELLKHSAANAAAAGKKKSGLGKLASSFGGSRHQEGVPDVSAAMAEGKTLFDVMREEGMKRYKTMEEEIKKNGETWLKEEAEAMKKMEEEAMKEMKQGMFSWIPGMGGSKGPSSA